MSISNNAFCKKCKMSDGEERQNVVCSRPVMEGSATCEDYDTGGIANEINAAWLEVMPNLADRNKLKPGYFSVNSGKLMVKGEKEDMIEDTEFEIKKKIVGSGPEFDWFFNENGTEKSYTKEYLKSSPTALDEQKDMSKDVKSMSDKIEEKLRDIYFYSISAKGDKERIEFNLRDKKNIELELRDLSNQNRTGDKAFVMAVVRAMGKDSNDEFIVRLGSYPKDSNVNLGFEERGLGSLIGTQYFSIINIPGPDDRDFEIKKGDVYDNIEFNKDEESDEPKSKESIQTSVKDEPYEQVMMMKEKKGLESLVNTNEVGNNFTKKQKELLEKLKRSGYLFKKPVDESGYDVKNVKSSEFTESFKVWKKK